MMTMEKIKGLIIDLDIEENTSDWEVRDSLCNLGYSPKEIKVSDGASKICLVFADCPFVVKWSTRGYDEAMREVDVYGKAEKAGLAHFFPRTAFFFTWNGVDFVVQEKVDTDCDHLSRDKYELYQRKSRTASYRIVSKMEKRIGQACGGNYSRNLNSLWASMALVMYGKAVCKALCDFIVENDINDLHECNIGYKNDRPILLDFSGYNRDY